MKKFLLALTASFLVSTTTFAASGDMTLPPPNGVSSGEISVTEALAERKSSRNFVDKEISPAQLSKILWAANGINREDGKRTVPAAMGVYSVEVYAVTREGIYLYDVEGHKLRLIAEGDHRAVTSTGQAFASKAAVNLVYVETPKVWEKARRIPPREGQPSYANVTVGAMVQSVALMAQTEGLGNCVRGSINRDEFKKVAGLSDEKTIILAQSVGHIK